MTILLKMHGEEETDREVISYVGDLHLIAVDTTLEEGIKKGLEEMFPTETLDKLLASCTSNPEAFKHWALVYLNTEDDSGQYDYHIHELLQEEGKIKYNYQSGNNLSELARLYDFHKTRFRWRIGESLKLDPNVLYRICRKHPLNEESYDIGLKRHCQEWVKHVVDELKLRNFKVEISQCTINETYMQQILEAQGKAKRSSGSGRVSTKK